MLLSRIDQDTFRVMDLIYSAINTDPRGNEDDSYTRNSCVECGELEAANCRIGINCRL